MTVKDAAPTSASAVFESSCVDAKSANNVQTLTSKDEWRKHWPLVLAAMLGMSLTSMAMYAIGLFIEPLSKELQWSRAEISSGLAIFSMLAVPLSPFAGALVDRLGSRRLAIPGTILTGLGFAAFGLVSGSIVQWIVLWVCYSLAAIAIKTTVWTAAVSSVFDKGRGMALAVTLSGAAVAQVLAPVIANGLIDAFGWRLAFNIMGIGWSGIVAIFVLGFFFDARDKDRKAKAHGALHGANDELLGGLSTKEALRSVALWRIAMMLLLSATLMVGLAVHQVPILTEFGLTRGNAAMLASLGGFAALAGKLICGWVLDRDILPYHSSFSVALAGVACLFLLFGPSLIVAVLAVAALGYAFGSYLQIAIYLTTRYGGLRNYGKIFGVMSSMLGFAAGIGPVIAGYVYDSTGSYQGLLLAGIPVALVSATLITRLGPYPDWKTQ